MQEPPAIPNQAPPPLPPPVYYQPMVMGITDEDRSLAMLCHLLAIFTGFLGPLVLWLVKKDNPYMDHHGREALNFQITVLLVSLGLTAVTVVLMFLIVGIFLVPLLFVLPILVIIAEVMAAVAAQRGEWYRYPCCIRLF